jgi:hypothetical protein
VGNNAEPVRIGGGVSDRFTKAYIDEIGVWNRELSENEIIGLYNESIGRQVRAPSDFVELEWDFEITGAVADADWVTFTLGMASPLKRRFPFFYYIAKHCNWLPGSAECGLSITECDRTLDACRAYNNSARFGGTPGLSSGGIRLA